MKIKTKVLQDDVWNHWKKVEKLNDPNFRNDIRDPLPKNLSWYNAVIEEADLSRLYIISSGDWTEITDSTFRVLEAVKKLNMKEGNKHTQRISTDIKNKIDFINDGNSLDNKLIAVTNSAEPDAPITFIEGNKRSVTFCLNNSIIGCEIFLGISAEISKYTWASQSYL